MKIGGIVINRETLSILATASGVDIPLTRGDQQNVDLSIVFFSRLRAATNVLLQEKYPTLEDRLSTVPVSVPKPAANPSPTAIAIARPLSRFLFFIENFVLFYLEPTWSWSERVVRLSAAYHLMLFFYLEGIISLSLSLHTHATIAKIIMVINLPCFSRILDRAAFVHKQLLIDYAVTFQNVMHVLSTVLCHTTISPIIYPFQVSNQVCEGLLHLTCCLFICTLEAHLFVQLSFVDVFGLIRRLTHDRYADYAAFNHALSTVFEMRSLRRKYPQYFRPRTRSSKLESCSVASFQADPSVEGVDLGLCWQEGQREAGDLLSTAQVRDSYFADLPSGITLLTPDGETIFTDASADDENTDEHEASIEVQQQDDDSNIGALLVQLDESSLSDLASTTNHTPTNLYVTMPSGEVCHKARVARMAMDVHFIRPAPGSRKSHPRLDPVALPPAPTFDDVLMQGDAFVIRCRYSNAKESIGFFMFEAATKGTKRIKLKKTATSDELASVCIHALPLAVSETSDSNTLDLTLLKTMGTIKIKAAESVTPVTLMASSTSDFSCTLNHFNQLFSFCAGPPLYDLPFQLPDSLPAEVVGPFSDDSLQCRFCSLRLPPKRMRAHVAAHFAAGHVIREGDDLKERCAFCGSSARPCLQLSFTKFDCVASNCPFFQPRVSPTNPKAVAESSNVADRCRSCKKIVFRYSMHVHLLLNHNERKQLSDFVPAEELYRLRSSLLEILKAPTLEAKQRLLDIHLSKPLPRTAAAFATTGMFSVWYLLLSLLDLTHFSFR